MNSIDTFPENLPLRESLPKMREETQAGLINWACAQPGSMSWLLRRSAAYWEKHVGTGTDLSDETYRAIEATCALELLRHRTACPTDREAVEHLNSPLALS
jgi:hypothetical protein